MNLICFAVGHKTVDGYEHCLPYFKISMTATDGIGRVHAWLETECERCGERYSIGMVHLPTDPKNFRS
jgi:hypothetical protein